MKKFLIGVLLIIPIIVVMIVTLTVAAVKSSGHISVEYIEIYQPDYTGQGIIEMKDGTLFNIANGNVQLTAKTYPMSAENKKVMWKIEGEMPDVEGANVVDINQNGLLKFYQPGRAVVTAIAEGDVRKTLSIEVVSDDVVHVEIGNVPNDIKVGDKFQLESVLMPRGAKKIQQYVEWKVTSNSSCIKLDQNGFVTALKSGKVDIEVKIQNPTKELKLGNKHIAKVSLNISKSDNKIFNSLKNIVIENNRTISEFLNSNYNFDNVKFKIGNIEKSINDKLVFENHNEQIVIDAYKNNNLIESATLIYKKIYVENSNQWQKIDNKYNLKIGNVGYKLNILGANENNCKISNKNVINFENGYLFAVSKGEATLTIEKNGVLETLNFKVIDPIYSLTIGYNVNEDKNMGIEGVRVFGKKSFDQNGDIVDEVNLYINSLMSLNGGNEKAIFNKANQIDSFMPYLIFELTKKSIKDGFAIADNGYTLLTKNSTSNQAELIVRPKYPIYNSAPIISEYTMNFIDDDNSVNVGNFTKSDEYKIEKEVLKTDSSLEKLPKKLEKTINYQKSIKTVEQFTKANEISKNNILENKNILSIVIHNELLMNGKTTNLYSNIYGNGHYMRQTQENDEIGIAENKHLLKINIDNITIQNLHLRAARALKMYLNEYEEEVPENLYVYKKAGNGIVVDGREKEYFDGKYEVGKIKNINIKYCIIENCFYGVYAAAADLNIEGTLFRNTGGQALCQITSVQNIADNGKTVEMNSVINLKKDIFMNSINMAIGMIAVNLGSKGITAENLIDDAKKQALKEKKEFVKPIQIDVDGNNVNEGSVSYIKKYFEKTLKSRINIENCELYNWIDASNLNMSYLTDLDMDFNADDLGSLLGDFANNNNLWENIILKIGGFDLKHMRFKDSKHPDVARLQMPIGNVGVNFPPNGEISDENLKSNGLTGLISMDMKGLANSSMFKKYLPKDKVVNWPIYFYGYNVDNPKYDPYFDANTLFSSKNARDTYNRMKG